MKHALDTRLEAVALEAVIDCVGPVGGPVKRSVDIVVALSALFLLFPAMLFVAAAIKLSMGGPVLFSQPRIGYGGRIFKCLKFRSMRLDSDAVLARYLQSEPAAAAEWQSTRKLRNDPRVTAFGALLRKTSFDELPQLFNVLRGDMSCVGPRPVVPDELELYGVFASDYLKVRPGVTGLWQVAGRNNVSYPERVAMDSHYVRNWSVGIDLIILVRTISAVLLARGSY
jgi:exopolysaccharide production protein ExoY